MNLISFFFLGGLVGTIGTMIGAGGGFILVPVLVFLFPNDSAAQITAISLFAVACNTTSGSIGYLRHKKVHLRSAFWFTIAGLPGAWLGVALAHKVDREVFNRIFAGLMFTTGAYFVLKRREPRQGEDVLHAHHFFPTTEKYVVGSVISFFVGMMASFLGIGGGIIHVPLLSEFLKFPIHIATGTSHFILAVTAIFSSVLHYLRGELKFDQLYLLPLALGIILGAQVGVFLAKKVKENFLIKLLGMALIIVSIRVFLT